MTTLDNNIGGNLPSPDSVYEGNEKFVKQIEKFDISKRVYKVQGVRMQWKSLNMRFRAWAYKFLDKFKKYENEQIKEYKEILKSRHGKEFIRLLNDIESINANYTEKMLAEGDEEQRKILAEEYQSELQGLMFGDDSGVDNPLDMFEVMTNLNADKLTARETFLCNPEILSELFTHCLKDYEGDAPPFDWEGLVKELLEFSGEKLIEKMQNNGIIFQEGEEESIMTASVETKPAIVYRIVENNFAGLVSDKKMSEIEFDPEGDEDTAELLMQAQQLLTDFFMRTSKLKG